MKKANLALLALVFLAGCGAPAPEATVIVTEIVSTKAPAAEQVLEVTIISAPTDKPAPSPTVPARPQLPPAFMDTAREYCDNAFNPDTTHTSALNSRAPAIALMYSDYVREAWIRTEFVPLPEDPNAAETLICIQQTRIDRGTYKPSGGTAYQLQWDVWLLSWPEGALLGSRTIMGGSPPHTKTGTGSRYGKSPQEIALAWVEAVLSEPFVSMEVPLYSLAYIPEGASLLTNYRATVYKLDALTGEERGRFEFSDPSAYRVTYSPDGRLATAALCTQIEEDLCIAGEVEVRSLESGEHVFTLCGDPEYPYILSLAFSPDGRTLLSGHSGSIEGTTREQIWRWDMSNGRGDVLLEGDAGHVYKLRVSPDRNTFAANINGDVRLFDLQSGEQVSVADRMGMNNWPSFVFSPDGSILAVSYCEATGYFRCTFGGIMLWDIAGEAEIASWPIDQPNIHSMAFSPDGATLASAVCSQTRSWITAESEPIHTCTAVEINQWNTVDGTPLRTFDAHLAGVDGLAFSPDGTELLSASYDGTIRVWEME